MEYRTKVERSWTKIPEKPTMPNKMKRIDNKPKERCERISPKSSKATRKSILLLPDWRLLNS